MSKISLNFYGETFSTDKTNNLSSLRKEISILLCLSSQDAEEIIMTYNNKGNKITILNDNDLNTFLNSESKTIDLNISQQSQIFKENLNQLQEEKIKDKKALDELIKKNEELEKLKKTKFISENQEIGSLKLQIEELIAKQRELIEIKNEIENQVSNGIKQIEQEQKENNTKIFELQKKLGIQPTEDNKFRSNHINNSVFGYKMGAKDIFGNNIFEKKEEKENKLNEKFKNLSLNSNDEEDIKEEDKKHKENKDNNKRKEIHYRIICDGCNMEPIMGKRYRCKVCDNFDLCEKCYENNKTNMNHKHEFECIEKSEFPKPNNVLQSSFNFGNYGNFRYDFPFFHSNQNRKRKRSDEQPNVNNNTFFNPVYRNIHFGVQCDGCGVTPIIGTRYKCTECDFDYCEQCEKQNAKNHGHKFQKL